MISAMNFDLRNSFLGFNYIHLKNRISSISRAIHNLAIKIFSCAVNHLTKHFKRNSFFEGRCEHFQQTRFYNHLKRISCFEQVSDETSFKKAILDWRRQEDKSSREVVDFYLNKGIWEEIKFFDQLSHSADSINLSQLSTKFYNLHKIYGDSSRLKSDDFDPIYFGNLPFSWFEDGKSQLIRMPTPTVDRKNGISICPLFEAYLNQLQDLGEKHLYVNLMDRVSQNNETKRSDVLQNAELTNPALCYIALDKSSNKYKNVQFSSELSAFTLEVNDWLDDPKYHFYSSKIDQKVLIKQAILKVLESFSWSDELSPTEKSAFIDLVHLEMVSLIVESQQPSSFNMSCKNCIDRGGSMQALYVAYNNLKSGKDIWNSNLSKFVLTIPFLVSGRVMQEDRFEKMSVLLELMQGQYIKG